MTRESTPPTIPNPAAAAHSTFSSRLQSLDALRGLTIALMILVNTSGDSAHTYRILAHSHWNGCTLADVVFPCFLFMVGISLVLSLNGRMKRGVPRSALAWQACKRTLILFLLGIAVNGFPLFPLHTLRVFGVLQRIALCYLWGTLLYLRLRSYGLLTLTFALLLGYWALLRWVPVPGFGMPAVNVPFLDPRGNLPAWLDRHLVPASHLYHQGFYDPEGLLSSVSALASTLIGVLTGLVLAKPATTQAKLKPLLAAGLVCLLSGAAWNHWLPLNKRLWTSSFVLFNAGISLLVLCFFLWWLDIYRKKTSLASPLLIFGANALAVYIFSEFLASFLSAVHIPGSAPTLHQALFRPLAATIPNLSVAALIFAIFYTGLCFILVLLLHHKQIYLKV